MEERRRRLATPRLEARAFTQAVEFLRTLEQRYGMLADTHRELLVRDLCELLVAFSGTRADELEARLKAEHRSELEQLRDVRTYLNP